MSISSINSTRSIYQNQSLYQKQNQNLQKNQQQLSSGKRVNTAADDAAALKIIQKLLEQSNGLDMGARNAATSRDMINVAEGAMSGITDSLQRMGELSVQAGNTAIYGYDDLSAIQQEMDQLKQSVSDMSGTQFNGKNIVDGSMGSSHVASGANGSGLDINMPNATPGALGLSNYNVTEGDFDISSIDNALNNVLSSRSALGAASNRLSYTINNNSYTSFNLTASRSRLEDLDYGKAVSDMKKNSLLQEYRLMMQKKQQNEYGKVTQLMRF